VGGHPVGPQARREYLAGVRDRYPAANRAKRSQLVSEVVANTGYHRKAVIRLLRRPEKRTRKRRKGRPVRYGPRVVGALRAIWQAAGYPWSARLRALLPVWLPWARRRLRLSAETEARLRTMSPRQMDRVLRADKAQLRKRLYGRTKPGTLLKHHIPLRTDRWDVTEPGWSEIDLVSHSGDCAEGEFAYTLDLTDIDSTWVERRALLGKSQVRVQTALAAIQAGLPFRLRGIDSDNGPEFINAHLHRYCQTEQIQFTRGRPYKKDDNAHIEQKNWTHVRKILGYVRYDTPEAVAAINDVYTDLRLLQNLFLPCVKLITKERVGARVRRVYDAPQTPLDRLVARSKGNAATIATLYQQRTTLDPFALAARIEHQLDRIYQLANDRTRPSVSTRPVDGARQGDAPRAPTRSLDARTQHGRPHRPPASPITTSSVTGVLAR
jgi:hypothetical protein